MQSVASSASVGKSIVIRGELTGAEDLIIDGIVEGTVRLPGGRLTIGPDAHVTAELTAKDIVILGTVKGNVTASDRVELRKSAVLHGDIAAARLAIEEGATVLGKANLTGESGAARTSQRTP